MKYALTLLLLLPISGAADGPDMVLIAKTDLQALLAQYQSAVEHIDRLEKALQLAKIKSGCV